ncbi:MULTISPECIES: hypothetical protein [Methylomonas]|uniref:hypothetical protein n=1 Tax=Methylomonas TaxID=416 RepID=UPI000B284035|nr:hypothetical protein [Methylomonas koyamae]
MKFVRLWHFRFVLVGSVSPHLSHVSEEFASRDFDVQINKAAYEFQRGGNQMLVIKPK